MKADRVPLQESHLQLDHAVEVIGQVKPDLSIKVLLSTDFGTNFSTKPAATL